MPDRSDSKPLSRQIEDTIEGFFHFLIAYARTTLVIAFNWRSGLGRILFAEDRRSPRYVYPFTFLVVGGFLFSLIIATYPQGLLGIADLIWFDKEIGANITKKFDQAFSITTLIVGGFPTFAAVVALSHVAAWIEERDGHRQKELKAAYRYLFGYQAAVLFLWLAMYIFIPASGIEPCSYIASLCGDQLAASVAGYAALLSFPLFFLVAPLCTLGSWRWRSASDRSFVRRTFHIATSLVFFSIIMVAYSTTAGLPGRIAKAMNPEPAVSLKIVDASVAVPRNENTAIEALATMTNATDDFAVLRSADLHGTLFIEGDDYAIWTVDKLAMTSSNQIASSLVALAPHSIATIKITGSLSLAESAQAEIRQHVIKEDHGLVALKIVSYDPPLSATGYIHTLRGW